MLLKAKNMNENRIISKEDVEKVAGLARIEIDENEKEKFAGQLSDILGYFKELSQLDLGSGDFEKVKHLDTDENQARKDELIEYSEEERENIRKQFPDRKENYLKVKAVL